MSTSLWVWWCSRVSVGVTKDKSRIVEVEGIVENRLRPLVARGAVRNDRTRQRTAQQNHRNHEGPAASARFHQPHPEPRNNPAVLQRWRCVSMRLIGRPALARLARFDPVQQIVGVVESIRQGVRQLLKSSLDRNAGALCLGVDVPRGCGPT